MIRIAAGDRMVLELAEVAGEGDVLGAADVLVAEEQHLVLQQQGADLGDQVGVARGVAEVDVRELRADRAGQRLDPDASAAPCWKRGRGARLRYGLVSCGHLFSSYRAGRDPRRAAPLSAGFVESPISEEGRTSPHL